MAGDEPGGHQQHARLFLWRHVDRPSGHRPPHIVGAIFAATIYTARSNGREHPPVYGATLNTSTTRTRIGSNSANTAAAFWNGVVRHVLVTTELTQAQRLALEGWLAWDGGLLSSLPATHPYRWAVA
jgi:hypothetical protein